MKKVSRRKFLKYLGVTGAGATLFWHGDVLFGMLGGKREALAAIPGGTLDPKVVPKYVTPLVIPPVMPFQTAPHNYNIAVKQFTQQILPGGVGGFPVTTVWSYGSNTNLAGTLNYPAFTIEATRGVETRIRWENGLVDGSNNFLPHLLPVDQTLHWANPPGGTTDRDTRPDFTGLPTPGPYVGPVPIVTHVHGMERVADYSDGYAEAWYLPNAGNIPAGYARFGTWFSFFQGKSPDSAGWGNGRAIFRYPNTQRPSTAWYHDHTLGMTRLNVYAGPAGFYIIRSAAPGDNPTVTGGGAAVLPGPAPQLGDAAGTKYYEIPIAIQDRSFNLSGQLFYPDSRAFFDGYLGPYIPDTDVSPIWNPEFFGNHIVVNGKTWPFLDVEPRRYRFRLLNGCQSRFLILTFDDPKVQVWQIGNEGGFLKAPVQLKQLLMGPAERADVIVDFTNVKFGKSVTMRNSGPDFPFGGGGFKGSDPQTTGQVMRFNVVNTLVGTDTSTPPAQLIMPNVPNITPTVTRTLGLAEIMATPPAPPIPVEARLGTFDTNVGLPAGLVPLKWEDDISENPDPFASETWEIYNFTADAHPIHIHEVFFQVVNRQRLDKATGLPIQAPRPPEAWEDGFKDTVIAYPGEVTRVKMTFGPGGQFVWHCHIVEHEDNEMMRPYRIGPVQPGQPV